MIREDDRAWFAPKRIGYGSSLPIRWQGWAAVAALLAGLLAARWELHGASRIVAILSLIALFAALCAMKTEGGWRWRR